VLDQGTRNVDPGRFFEAKETGCWVDLEDHGRCSVHHEVDPALAEPERSGSSHSDLDLLRLRLIRFGRASARRVGTPLPVPRAKPGRRDNRLARNQEPVAGLPSRNPTLHDNLVSDTPQAVEHPFEMSERFAPNNADTHPRAPLFHDYGKAEDVIRRCSKRFRVRPCHRGGNRQARCRQGPHRCPMIPTDADGLRMVGGGRTTAEGRLERREETFRSPVTDSRNDNGRRQRSAFTIHELHPAISKHRGRRVSVDDCHIDTKRGCSFDKPLVGAKIRAGSQEEEIHRAMVTHGHLVGILVQ